MKGENKTALGILLLGGVGIGGYFLWKYLKAPSRGFIISKIYYQQGEETPQFPIAGQPFDVVIIAKNMEDENITGYCDLIEYRAEGETCNATDWFCGPNLHCLDIGDPNEGMCLPPQDAPCPGFNCFTGYSCVSGVCTTSQEPIPVFSESATVEPKGTKIFVYSTIMPDTVLNLLIKTGRIIEGEKEEDHSWPLEIHPTILFPEIEISNLAISFPPF